MNKGPAAALRVVLADDEPLARLRLSKALKACGCEVLAEFEDGIGLTAWLETAPCPDALFLDVRMPGATGLEILADVGNRMPVVLVTANPEFAVHAFEFAALDFLVKPVSPERLARCLDRVRERLGRLVPPAQPTTSRIPVRAGDGTLLLELRKVSHLECEEGLVWAWAGGSRFRTAWRSLPEAERELEGAAFVRVNRTVMVRPEAVKGLRTLPNGRRRLRLGDGVEVDASRQGTHSLEVALGLE
jgi:two-component system, LytTR family, response regulator